MKCPNRCLVLCLDHMMKVLKDLTCFRFAFKKIDPSETCVIIDNRDKTSLTMRSIDLGRSPYVTVNERECIGRCIYFVRERSTCMFGNLTNITLEISNICIYKQG